MARGKLEMSIGLNVDRPTAEACLKLVELYINATNAEVICTRDADGTLTFEYKYPGDVA